jgi:cytidine deaminase
MSITSKILSQKAYEAMQMAYAPYSKFQVGACVLSEDGTLYCGSNIENASYGLTVCAERVAIFTMVAAGKKKIKALAVSGSTDNACAPCGACRQVIREFASLDTPIYMCNCHGKIIVTMTLEGMLPESFGPEFLDNRFIT